MHTPLARLDHCSEHVPSWSASLGPLGRGEDRAQAVDEGASPPALGSPRWDPEVKSQPYQVDNDSPGVGDRVGHRQGDKQKDKDLLHDEWAQLV